ncbi:MAG: dUTP diphosphatase [Calditerrivibrio sp.]|nr:dUTP diphosphatase [Calditerrivibrio sp.]
MKRIVVNIKLDTDAIIPEYATTGSSGVDVRSIESGVINPSEIKLVKTGLFLEIPEGYEAQIRPRSGLALKHGITILNSPGTIDSDYRGEVCLILANFGNEPFEYKKGDRLAQMVFTEVVRVDFELIEDLNKTERGIGGFGHSGTN